MPMVQYWMTSDASPAAITTNSEGASIMKIGDGDRRETYDFPGFPRSHMLYGTFKGRPHGPVSVLKHEIKTQIFNECWKLLEEGKDIRGHIREVLPKIFELLKDMEYDMIPHEKMFKGVKEIWRAMTVLEKKYQSKNIENLKKVLCLIMSEDDAYRLRVSWIVQIFSWFRDPAKNLEIALGELEHAEVVRDMKEKAVLLKTVLVAYLKDPHIRKLFNEFFKEVDWKKVRLSEGDKYHFRAKYFKVDLDKFEY